jgi:hypothetical protein
VDDSWTIPKTARALLIMALGDAIRSGVECGDSALVRVASRALAELVGT